MTKQGSYQFEKLEGRGSEAAFLAERAHMRLDGFPDLVRRHGFSGYGNVLELGTGHGIRARLLAGHYPDCKVVAIDRSDELLAAARAEGASLPNLTFQNADLYELPFEDESFDFVYARLVFMHLTDPARAIAEIRRVLKIGGRVLIEDADRDCMFFEPAPASLADFWRKVQDGQRRLGGDPNVGRKLAPLLRSANFETVKIEIQNLLGGGPEIDFLVRTLMPSLNIYLEVADRAAGAVAIADLAELARDPAASFYHFWFVVSAVKAGALEES